MRTFSNRKPRSSFARISAPATIAGSLLLVMACATTPPPTAEIAVSKAAVSDASGAGGAEFAPSDMKSARDKLDRAEVAMAAKDYDRALSLAQEAQVDAKLAEVKADSSKARKAADELSEDTRVLQDEIDRKNQ
jgi:hypothetical protein